LVFSYFLKNSFGFNVPIGMIFCVNILKTIYFKKMERRIARIYTLINARLLISLLDSKRMKRAKKKHEICFWVSTGRCVKRTLANDSCPTL